jgi:hypothetical protein
VLLRGARDGVFPQLVDLFGYFVQSKRHGLGCPVLTIGYPYEIVKPITSDSPCADSMRKAGFGPNDEEEKGSHQVDNLNHPLFSLP